MTPHPAIPKNATLWALYRLLDQANRWKDHADSIEDFNIIEDFIADLEIKINEMIESCQYLKRCLSHSQ